MNKKQASKDKREASARNSFCNATYYGVITCSLLVGVLAYSAGASLEGALMRVLITLLACTALGYLLNVVLWLSKKDQPAAPAEPPPTHEGARVNLTVGDDRFPA